jgi:hypothetical protein
MVCNHLGSSHHKPRRIELAREEAAVRRDIAKVNSLWQVVLGVVSTTQWLVPQRQQAMNPLSTAAFGSLQQESFLVIK